MKTVRTAAWVSLVAAGQLVLASAAHAQAPTPGAPPAGAQPYAPPTPPPGYPPAGYPPPPPGYPAGAPPAGTAPPLGLAPPVAGPVVQLNSDNPKARLQTMQLKWRDVCMTPCGVPVDPNAVYRVGGGTIRPSNEFKMPRPAGTVLVNAETGSTVKHWVGIGLIAGGAGWVLAGAATLAAGSDTRNFDGTTSDSYKALGITYLVIGGIMAAIGIPLSMSSTSVEVR